MASKPIATAYDELPYPGAVQNWTHPDQMAIKALLAGMQPAPIENCRVLELGCGDGINLAATAFHLPASRFVGIDLAKGPLETGMALAGKLGIKNVEFQCADILDLGAELGEFDYISVPGLYSWVPANVRDKLLELCGACLAPQGVAIISYNAYPGCYPSTMVRDMMAFHVRAIGDPRGRIRQARGLLHVLNECQHGGKSTYKAMLEQEMKRIVNYPDEIFYHDDLSPSYHPVFFYQFVEHAEQHGLQYLGERSESALNPEDFPEQIRPALRQLSECNLTEREQYLDFIYARRFRCTFLCREDVDVEREGQRRRIDNLQVGLGRNNSIETVIDAESGLSFVNETGTLATTKHPLLVAAVSHLKKVRPRSLPFSELLAAARAREGGTGGSASDLERDTAVLESFILKCFATQFLSLGTWSSHFVDRPSERPTANALARALVRTVRFVPSASFDSVEIGDELGKRLVESLDGSRDRSSLLAELNRAVETGDAPLPEGATSVTPEMLEQKLQALAKLGLLTA